MKFGLSGRLFESRSGYTVNLREFLVLARDLGYDGVEIRYPQLPLETPAAQVAEAASWLRELNLTWSFGTVEGIVGEDIKLDRVLVREPNGVLAGRTRLSSILSFYKARALKNAKKAQEALELLKTMAFDTGKIFVDGKVTGLTEAVEKLTAEVAAMAARFFFRAVLRPLRGSALSYRL